MVQRVEGEPTGQLIGPFTVFCLVLNCIIGCSISAAVPKVLTGTDSIGGISMTWAFSGVAMSCGILYFLELGLHIPFHNITDKEIIREVPRSGGEMNFVKNVFHLTGLGLTRVDRILR
jgi:hypothetical protein